MKLLAAASLVVLLAAACGPRPSAVLGHAAGGCADALRERAAAMNAIDTAEKQAVQRSAAWAGELQAVASEAKGAIAAVADLAPCGRPEAGGVVVDLADLRARYGAVVEQSTARLSEVASRPAPRGNEKRGGGKKDDDND